MTVGLDPARRAALAADLIAGLQAAAAGSRVLLRGSLADGRADAYSDIDLLWAVDDGDFSPCVTRLKEILSEVRPVASLRFDPDLQRSDRRRLAFVRFAMMPLFWRVDLDIVARSVASDPRYDLDNPAAPGSDWSWAESALANAIGAVKASLRRRDDDALALLGRAYERLGLAMPARPLPELIATLADAAAANDERTAPLAARVKRLAAESL